MIRMALVFLLPRRQPPARSGRTSITPSGLTTTNYEIQFVGGVIIVIEATPVFGSLRSPTITDATAPATPGGTLSAGPVLPSGAMTITANSATQSAPVNMLSGSGVRQFFWCR